MATTIFLYDHVSEYAAQVRVALADLTPEQVDDLTDGLEADLMEAVEDPTAPSGSIPVVDPGAARDGREPSAGALLLDLSARFGSAADYAQELRAAAGLPAAASVPPVRRRGPSGALRAMGNDIRETGADARRAITGHPRWPAVKDFLLVLRPVWWVVRAWVLATIVASFLGGRAALVVALVGLTIVSVQYGRGRWTVPERWSWAPTLLSALALVLLLPFAAAATDGGERIVTSETYYDVPPGDGVYVNGELVGNLFVYGADGTFLDGAQIVDDEGRPVRIGDKDPYDPETDLSTYVAPRTDEYDRDVWNAYPLPTWTNLEADWVEGEAWVLPEGTEPRVPAPPVAQLAPLEEASADTAPAEKDDAAPDPGSSDPSAAPTLPGEAPAPDAPPQDAPAPDAPLAPESGLPAEDPSTPAS